MSGTTDFDLSLAAQALFATLSPEETAIVEAAQKGRVARFDPDDPPTVRAALIAWLATRPRDALAGAGLRVYGVELDGALDLSGALIDHRIALVNCNLKGVELSDAQTRTIVLDGSSCTGLGADRAEVRGSFQLRSSPMSGNRRPVITGLVSFAYATVQGNVSLNGAIVDRPEKLAVRFTEATVEGSLYLGQAADGEPFTCNGRVELFGVTVHKQLALIGTRFTTSEQAGETRTGINLRRARIGTLSMVEGFDVAGPVHLTGAVVGVFQCSHATFRRGLLMHATSVTEVFRWVDVTLSPDSWLNWRFASIQTFQYDSSSWPAAGALDLRGISFGALFRHPGDDEDERVIRDEDIVGFLDVIRLQTRHDGGAEYSPQPYEQLAAALRASGQERAAQQVLIARGDDAARAGRRLARPFLWLFKVTVGYGYRPLRVIWWLIGVFLVSAAVFRIAYHAGDFGYTARVHPPFSSLAFSLDSLLPFIDLGQERAWTVRTAGISPASVYYWCHVCVGWLLSSFVVAGVARTAR